MSWHPEAAERGWTQPTSLYHQVSPPSAAAADAQKSWSRVKVKPHTNACVSHFDLQTSRWGGFYFQSSFSWFQKWHPGRLWQLRHTSAESRVWLKIQGLGRRYLWRGDEPGLRTRPGLRQEKGWREMGYRKAPEKQLLSLDSSFSRFILLAEYS